MTELDRQVENYKQRCDRGEDVSRSDAIWLLNELVYERDSKAVPPPERREAPPTAEQFLRARVDSWRCHAEVRSYTYSEVLEMMEAYLRASSPAAPHDEEMMPHAFKSRTPYEPGDDRDIWCKDCEYHRDHAIHRASPAAHAARRTCINCATPFGDRDCRYYFGAHAVGPLCESCDRVVKTHTLFRDSQP